MTTVHLLLFVAGAIGGISTGYLAARRNLDRRRAVGPAHVPQHVRRAPTHPAQLRPVLFDQDDVA